MPTADNVVPEPDAISASRLFNSVISLNKYHPLLTDGKNLFTITMNLVTKRRKVKESMRKHYQQFQEEKKKKKEANASAESKSPADSKQAQISEK
jgi:hypothetical protein